MVLSNFTYFGEGEGRVEKTDRENSQREKREKKK